MLYTVQLGILKGYATGSLTDISGMTCIDFEQLPASAQLPADFPDTATVLKFLCCDRVKWRSLASEDDSVVSFKCSNKKSFILWR